MKTDLTKYIKKPSWPVIIALVVVAVIVVCWFAFGKQLWLNYVNRKTRDDAESYTGTNITPAMNFAGLRDRLMHAVSGPGTTESEIYSVLAELRTQADWEYLQRYWENSMDKVNIGWSGLILSGMMGIATTLIGTLKSELDRKELQRCREILAGNHIEPGF